MANSNFFDVIIIGGSYAGLSAAMSLGRSMRRVLIIDSGLPCNRQTPHSHNFITHDGEVPQVIARKAKEQVLRYNTVNIINDLATNGSKSDNQFTISTQGGLEFQSNKLLFATGIRDTMPAIKGFAECWGITVIHCPYCHGYEFRDQNTAIMGNGERAFHMASLVSNLTGSITLLTSGEADFNFEQKNRLNHHNIRILETGITEIEHENGKIRNVIFNDGSKTSFDAVYAIIPFEQHSHIPVSLGCELTEQGHLKVDMLQKTTVSGVFACGDNTSMMRSVANAVHGGNMAGAAINRELSEERFYPGLIPMDAGLPNLPQEFSLYQAF